jgi:PBSX family phage terminase large subunit
MPLSATQQTVANCDKRFRVVIAGRRWGKTTLAIREMCKIAREPGKDVYYISPTYRMSRTIIFKRLKEKLLDLRWVKKINETNLEFILKNGSTISLKGADNPDSLRGVSLSAAIFDEFAFMDSETWDLVIRPALADQQGSALFITTPVGKNNWAFDLFNMQQQHPDSWASFQYTTLQGGFVPEQEVEAARSEMTAQQFQQEFEASFVVGQSLVAWEFDRKDHVKELDNPNTAVLHVGMDFNVSPITAAIFVQKGDIMWQIDEIVMQNSNTQELSDELIRRYPQSRITCYPDPAGRQRKTSAGGQTDFTILTNAGFTVKAPSRHNAVRDRINSYNARLRSGTGDIRMFISNKCKYTIESLEKFQFKPLTQIPDKDSGFDHMFDAASYCIDYMWPLKRTVTDIKQPLRWAQALA